jgi:hypothetical protein
MGRIFAERRLLPVVVRPRRAATARLACASVALAVAASGSSAAAAAPPRSVAIDALTGPVLAGDRAIWVATRRDGPPALVVWDGRRVREIHRFPSTYATGTEYRLAASRTRIVVSRVSLDELGDVDDHRTWVFRRGTRSPEEIDFADAGESGCDAPHDFLAQESGDVAVSGTAVAVGRTDCSADGITIFDTRGRRSRPAERIRSGEATEIDIAGRHLAWSDFGPNVRLYDRRARRVVLRHRARRDQPLLEVDRDGTLLVATRGDRGGWQMAVSSPARRRPAALPFESRGAPAFAAGLVATLPTPARLRVGDLAGATRWSRRVRGTVQIEDFDGGCLLWTTFAGDGPARLATAAVRPGRRRRVCD